MSLGKKRRSAQSTPGAKSEDAMLSGTSNGPWFLTFALYARAFLLTAAAFFRSRITFFRSASGIASTFLVRAGSLA
jgi:hypothetical protein